MGRYAVLGGLTFLCALAFVAPAHAIMIDGINYVLFAKKAIELEDGRTTIVGHVGVNDVGGVLRVGAFNSIFGIARADGMFFGTASLVDACDFNTSTGIDPDAVCGSQAPAGAPMTAWPPSPVPAAPSCVETRPNLVVHHRGSASLAPDCYGDVRIADGATLTLGAGTYDFKSLRLENGSLLDGGGGAIVNVKGLIVTEPAVTIVGVAINSSASKGVVVGIGKGSFLEDVVLNAPYGTVQLQRGLVLGPVVEIVAKRIVVAPITAVVPD